MEAKELRIGNLLFFPFTNEFVEILGINAHETSKGIVNTLSFKKGLSLYCEKILVLKPIPLTKEWFEKFGYYNQNRPNHFEKDEYTIDAHTFWYCNGMFIDDKNGVRIKYVHQLQNLYFVLKQRELTIKKKIIIKSLKKILKTGSNGEEYLVHNPSYSKREKPTNIQPKKKKRK